MKCETFQVKFVQKKEKHVSRKMHISKNSAFRKKLRKIEQRKEAMDNIK